MCAAAISTPESDSSDIDLQNTEVRGATFLYAKKIVPGQNGYGYIEMHPGGWLGCWLGVWLTGGCRLVAGGCWLLAGGVVG